MSKKRSLEQAGFSLARNEREKKKPKTKLEEISKSRRLEKKRKRKEERAARKAAGNINGEAGAITNGEQPDKKTLKRQARLESKAAREAAAKKEEGEGGKEASSVSAQSEEEEIEKDEESKTKPDIDSKTFKEAATKDREEASGLSAQLNGKEIKDEGESKIKADANAKTLKRQAKLEKKAAKEAAAVKKAEKTKEQPKFEFDIDTTPQNYIEPAELSSLPQKSIESFLKDNHITITDPTKSNPLRPITSFDYLPTTFLPPLTSIFSTFKAPTPIQAASWPYLLSGRDLTGIAETGSGKTLAFALPCIRYISSLPKVEVEGKGKGKARVVVVSPTRELAMQIHAQMVSLASLANLTSVCVYGGVQKDEQRQLLKKASIVVATPGRLNDLIEEGTADLSNVGYLVLDEADRMLDKGFEEEIKKIIRTTLPSAQRQTLMFTATWPESIRALAATFMKDPVRVNIGEDNPTGDLRANTRITQTVEVMESYEKEQRLLSLIREHQSGKQQKKDRILIFCLYKKEAVRVQKNLQFKGLKVAAIHGDLGQDQRTANLDMFKKGEVSLLVATDVAARGLDIPAVKLVINNTFPLTVEDYVHRIGRTGRAGQSGLAVTFFTQADKGLSGGLINVLKAANQPVPEALLNFGGTVKKKGHDAYGAFYKDPGDAKASKKIKFDD